VFLVTKKPKGLANHTQRISYCFQINLNEQLFAAIIDLLVVLNQQGHAISWRMVLGAKSRLRSEQFDELKNYLKSGYVDVNLLSGNHYSVFSKGFVGVNKMIQQMEKEEQANDPLTIALELLSGLVTTISQVPVATPDKSRVQVIWLALTT